MMIGKARPVLGLNRPCRSVVPLFCLAGLLFLLGGCTPKIYNINMRYEPTKIITPAFTDGRRFSVTVASLTDRRKIDDTLLIGRVIKSDGTPIPVLPRYLKPADALTAALRELLARLGYPVSPDRPAWNLEEGAIAKAWGTILVGGTIDELEVTCVESLTTKRYSARARITLTFADVQKQRIFYRVSAESTSALDHITFSEERLEGQINWVLSDALEKAVEGPETVRRIREALNP
jgi:hypothetical protein